MNVSISNLNIHNANYVPIYTWKMGIKKHVSLFLVPPMTQK